MNKIKLEGWLFKYCGRGPLGGFKKRWLSFNNQTNKLECFKQKFDKIPLDSIDLKSSVLTINCQDELPNIYENSVNTSKSDYLNTSCNSFRIICNDKIWLLETSSSVECIKWLTSLQKLRKKLNDKKYDLNDEFDDLTELTESPDTFNDQQQKDQNDQNLNKTTVNKSRQNSTSSINSANSSTNSLDQHASKNRVVNLFSRIRKQDTTIKDQQSIKKCSRCKELEDQIIILQDDLQAYENEVYGNKEVIKVLQNQIEQIISEKDTYERLCNSLTIDKPDFDDFGNLAQKECEISQLKIKIKQLENQLSDLRNENTFLKEKSTKSKEDIKLLEEMLQVKDQTVISLTNEIFDLEKGNGDNFSTKTQSSFSSYLTANSFPTNETYIKPQLPKLDENEKLKDSVIAFQAQNQFLNKEIIELNEVKRQNEVKIQKLEWTVIEWEAKCACIQRDKRNNIINIINNFYQLYLQSKLLSLLKEINHNSEDNEDETLNNDNNDENKKSKRSNSIAQNESIKQIVQRLMDDDNSLDIPHSWRNGKNKRPLLSELTNSTTTTIIEYDELGFQNKITRDSNEFDYLFDHDELRKDSSFNEQEKIEWRQKWDTFISTISNNEQLTRTTELKLLLRSGVPQEYRPKIWKMCINMLIEHKKPLSDPNYYSNLVKASQRRQWNPSIKQIELDLLRTLPNNRNFESKNCDGIVRLRRVLTAYSQRNGMNRLAAVALLILNEEDSFWCLVAIIETIMPKDYYTQRLLGAHVDQLVLKDLIAEKLPNLNAHFEQYGVEISMFGWFLTCFIDNLPVNVFLRIWDSLLFEGSKVLFRFALAFFKYHEANLLKLEDMMAINQYLRIFGENTLDLNHLCNIAFNSLNPFPMSKIKQKRELHRQELELELERIENLKIATDSDKDKLDSQSD